jgi:hypothetical protein
MLARQALYHLSYSTSPDLGLLIKFSVERNQTLLEKVQVEPDYPVSGRKCTGK